MADDHCRPLDPDDYPRSPERLNLEERAAFGRPLSIAEIVRLHPPVEDLADTLLEAWTLHVGRESARTTPDTPELRPLQPHEHELPGEVDEAQMLQTFAKYPDLRSAQETPDPFADPRFGECVMVRPEGYGAFVSTWAPWRKGKGLSDDSGPALRRWMKTGRQDPATTGKKNGRTVRGEQNQAENIRVAGLAMKRFPEQCQNTDGKWVRAKIARVVIDEWTALTGQKRRAGLPRSHDRLSRLINANIADLARDE